MKVEIKDKDKQIGVALRAIGYNVNSISVETFLNVISFVRNNKSDTTLKDVLLIKEMVESLFKE